MTDEVAEAQAKAKAEAAESAETVAASEQENAPKGEESPTPKADLGDEDEGSKLPEGTVVEQVGSLIVDAGLKPEDVAKIVSENNGDLTPALFQQLVEKHGEGLTSIIADNLRSFNKDAVTKGNENDTAIFTHVQESFKGVTEQSGEETWKELSGWAKENIPNAERKEINSLLKQGGLSAKFAVDHLVKKFQSSDSYTQTASLESGDSVADSSGGAMIDRATYDRELRKLQSEGHDYNTSPEIAQLQRRRQKAIRRGH